MCDEEGEGGCHKSLAAALDQNGQKTGHRLLLTDIFNISASSEKRNLESVIIDRRSLPRCGNSPRLGALQPCSLAGAGAVIILSDGNLVVGKKG